LAATTLTEVDGINVFNGLEWQTYVRGPFGRQGLFGAVANLSQQAF